MMTSYADLAAVQHAQNETYKVQQTAARIVAMIAKLRKKTSRVVDVLAYTFEQLWNAGRLPEALLVWRELLRLDTEDANAHNGAA